MSERSVDGVRLHFEERGEGQPLLLLHGFSGSAAALAPLARHLARGWRVLAVDLLGHGRSEAPRDPEPYRMERCADQLAALLRERDARPAHVFGYSMGGRVALALAVLRPDSVSSLALLGASAGLADPRARAARVRDDRALADRIERDGVEAFARAWAELPLFASQKRFLSAEARAALQAQRQGNRAHGLANSLRGLGSGAQPPFHDALGALDVPVWLGHGVEDAKFAAIARDLAHRIPAAVRCPIPAAGHAAHLENPDAVLAELDSFFARAGSIHPPAAIRAASGGPS